MKMGTTEKAQKDVQETTIVKRKQYTDQKSKRKRKKGILE